MTYETIRLRRAPDGIARVTLNRPDRLNSFTARCTRNCATRWRTVTADAGVRVLLLTGAGRGFCAGQDLSDRAVAPGGAPVDLGASIESNYRPLVLALRTLPRAGRLRGQWRRGGRGRQYRAGLRPRRRRRSRRASSRPSARSASSRFGRHLLPAAPGRHGARDGPGAARRQAVGAAGGGLGPHLEVRRRRGILADRRGAARAAGAGADAGPGGDQARAATRRPTRRSRRSSTSSATCSANWATAPTIAKASPRSSTSARRASRASRAPWPSALPQRRGSRRHRRRRDGRGHRADRGAGRPSASACSTRGMGAAEQARHKLGDTLAGTRREGQDRRRTLAACRRRAHRRRARARATSSARSSWSRRSSRTSTAKRNLFRELEVVVGAGRDSRHQHVVAVDHRDRRGHEASGARRRHALLQSGAADAAGRGGQRPGHGAARSRPRSTRRRWRGARRRSTRRSTPGFIVNRCARPFYAEALRLPGRARRGSRDARRGHARGRRLSHGTVRADGPDRPRRQRRGDAQRVGGVLPRSALHAVGDAAGDGGRRLPRTQDGPRLLRLCGRRGEARRRRPNRRNAPGQDRRHRRPADGRRAVDAAGGGRNAASTSASPMPAFRRGHCACGEAAWLVPADGRTATAVAATAGVRDVVPSTWRSTMRPARGSRSRAPTPAAMPRFAAAVGALQAAGIAVSRLDDVAGLAVLRTVAMLANEAADAVTQGIGSAADVDLAHAEGRQLSARAAGVGRRARRRVRPRRAAQSGGALRRGPLSHCRR